MYFRWEIHQHLMQHLIQDPIKPLTHKYFIDLHSRIPKISPFKLNENFVNEFRNDEKNINNETFREYFGYRNPAFLEKDLLKVN